MDNAKINVKGSITREMLSLIREAMILSCPGADIFKSIIMSVTSFESGKSNLSKYGK